MEPYSFQIKKDRFRRLENVFFAFSYSPSYDRDVILTSRAISAMLGSWGNNFREARSGKEGLCLTLSLKRNLDLLSAFILQLTEKEVIWAAAVSGNELSFLSTCALAPWLESGLEALGFGPFLRAEEVVAMDICGGSLAGDNRGLLCEWTAL